LGGGLLFLFFLNFYFRKFFDYNFKMGLTEENVLKIVGMHLNKTNRTTKSVAQLQSLSKGLENTLGVTGNKERRFVKSQIVDFVNGFLKKKKRYKFSETEVGAFGDSLPFLKFQYYIPKEMIGFWEYYRYYYDIGQHKKEDFIIDSFLYHITIEDPEKLNEYYEDRGETLIPAIYIKYEHMKTILSTPPTSRTAFKKLKKQVYTRSRTRGFFKPSEVDEYAQTIIDFYLEDI